MGLICKIFDHKFKSCFEEITQEGSWTIFYQCSRCRQTKLDRKFIPPALNAEEFIKRFRRNYINYASLVEVAFGLGDEMFKEYERLTDEDKRVVINEAKKYAANA